MITIFQDRHAGMDSLRALTGHIRLSCLIDALWLNANPFQTDWCRNPVSMDGFELTIHDAGYPLPGGHDELAH